MAANTLKEFWPDLLRKISRKHWARTRRYWPDDWVIPLSPVRCEPCIEVVRSVELCADAGSGWQLETMYGFSSGWQGGRWRARITASDEVRIELHYLSAVQTDKVCSPGRVERQP
jgi:hypothetical protein